MLDNNLFDIKVYADYISDELAKLRDRNTDKFTSTDSQIINDAINLIRHNINELKEK